MVANPIFLRLFRHLVRLAASRTFWSADMVRLTRMPMMAMTISNSISVKPCLFGNRTVRMGSALSKRRNEKQWKILPHSPQLLARDHRKEAPDALLSQGGGQNRKALVPNPC